jgi:hypothetical protein
MLVDIKGEPIRKRGKVYVFEQGEGKLVSVAAGSNPWFSQEMLVQIGGKSIVCLSCNCFIIKKGSIYSRLWTRGRVQIEITCEPIKLNNRGGPAWVCYSADGQSRELILPGDRLHKDWDGNGVQFATLIDKWVRRLAGEVIPLSTYYQDPFNRWLDNLGDEQEEMR